MSTIRYDFEPGYCGEIIQADGKVLCTFSDEPDKATAARFVACWNACEGTSTPWLEGRASGLRMDGALSLEDQFDYAEKLRAALVEAEGRLTLLIARDEHKLLDVVARDNARAVLDATK